MPKENGEPTAWELAQHEATRDVARRQREADRANKLTEIRSHTLIESAKGLMLINGGGAVALAAFLGQIWDKPGAQLLRPWLLSAIFTLAIGVACAAMLSYIRYRTSLDERSLVPGDSPWWNLHRYVTWLCVLEFVSGMVLVVVGGFRALG